MESYVLKQVKVTLCVVLGNLMVGYSVGWSAPIAQKLKDPAQSPLSYPILDKEVSWVASIYVIGSIFGANAGGYIANKIGRKRSMLAFSLIHIVGYMIIAHAWSYGVMLAGRTLAGFGGSLVVTVYIYLGEIASSKIRGSLLALAGIFHVLGTLMVYSIGPYVSFSMVCYVCMALNCIHLIALCYVPESPVYQVMKDKEDEAKTTLLKLGRSGDIGKELPTIKDVNETFLPQPNKPKATAWKQFTREKKNRKAFLITTTLFCIQMSSGAMAIIFFSTTIFKNAQSSLDPNVGTIILGLAELCGAMLTPFLIERCGRNYLLLISTGSCSLCTGVLGTYFYLEANQASVISSVRWVPLVLMVVFLFTFNIGLGIVPNTLTGEMYSPNLRSTGSSISITISWSLMVATGASFGYMVAALHNHGVFWLYSAINASGFFFTAFVVPETKGKTLMEIGCLLEK